MNYRINKTYLKQTIKNVSGLVLLLLLIVLITGISADVAAQTKGAKKSAVSTDKKDTGDFLPVYAPVKNAKYKEFSRAIQQLKVLEDLTEILNSTLVLPTDVKITFEECGEPNAFYDPSKKTISMCYEFMELFYAIFVKIGYTQDEAKAMMFGAANFFFYHELGHCLIDVYDLPATGREEDAVDQLSTAILMDDLTEIGQVSALAGVLVFRFLAENEENSAAKFADEHSLSSQRFFNIACWMYGRSPKTFEIFQSNEVLPKDRAVRCSDEYQKLSKAWTKLLEPWMK